MATCLREGQELLVAVPWLARVEDLARGDLQRGEQGGGGVALVVIGLPLDLAGAHRQDRLGAIQRLALALLVHADHDRGPGRVEV